MILLKPFLTEIEMGGTAMHNTRPAPALVDLFNSRKIYGKVLDYVDQGLQFDFNLVQRQNVTMISRMDNSQIGRAHV